MASLYTQKKLLESLGFGFVEEEAPLPPEEAPRPAPHALHPHRPPARREQAPPPAPPKHVEPPLATLANLDQKARQDALDSVAAAAAQCEKCMLHNTRGHAVAGTGNPNARLMIVCDIPTPALDAGENVFDGAIGEMYAKMLKAMKQNPSDVYTSTAVACRPPNGRPVRPEEAESCRPFAVRQIEIIKPEIVVCFGLDAAATILAVDSREIKRTRGQWRDYRGVPLMPTMSLGSIHQNTTRKKTVWQDLQEVMKRMGV